MRSTSVASVAFLAVLTISSPLAADQMPEAKASQVVKPQPRVEPPPRQVKIVRVIHYHPPYRSVLYKYWPPTVMRDGNSYFYYPGAGRPDEPAHAIVVGDRHYVGYRRRLHWLF